MWRQVLIASLLLALPAVAGDGRVEINQAVVTAAGGFPYVISQPGSYVLTGNLVVPAATNGISLAADDITLDLNGFSIQGPFTCDASCSSSGSPHGVIRGAGVGNRVTVRNGTVRGFGGTCVVLRDDSHVERVLVRDCGTNGISTGSRSIVLSNRVTSTGNAGIFLGTPSGLYRDNVASDTGLKDPNNPINAAITGGSASGGNACADGSCSPRGARRYYQTKSTGNGTTPLTACDAGFHMASVWEILDPSNLHYDVARGYALADSGQGQPITAGWVRIGGSDGTVANCNGWASSDSAHKGPIGLPIGFIAPPNPDLAYTPWDLVSITCNNSVRTWCVED